MMQGSGNRVRTCSTQPLPLLRKGYGTGRRSISWTAEPSPIFWTFRARKTCSRGWPAARCSSRRSSDSSSGSLCTGARNPESISGEPLPGTRWILSWRARAGSSPWRRSRPQRPRPVTPRPSSRFRGSSAVEPQRASWCVCAGSALRCRGPWMRSLWDRSEIRIQPPATGRNETRYSRTPRRGRSPCDRPRAGRPCCPSTSRRDKPGTCRYPAPEDRSRSRGLRSTGNKSR